jgi:surface antigen
MALPTGQSTYFNDAIYFGGTNPTSHIVGSCVWYAVSKALAKAKAYPDRNINAKDLKNWWGGEFIDKAIAAGYTTGDTPKADSIAVWVRSGRDGHVAYVEAIEGSGSTTGICFSEANWYTNSTPNDQIIVPSTVKATIATYVASLAPNVTVKDLTSGNQSGTDGLFKADTLKTFPTRRSSTSVFKFVYLTP